MPLNLPVTPEQLRVLSHETRMVILENLSYRGALTATQLAHLVGDSPSNCSWHLRKLASVGFVERAPGTNERDRPWRIAFTSDEFEDAEADARVRSLLVHRQADRMLRAMSAADTPERDSRDESHEGPPAFHGSNATWLTEDEARQLGGAFRRLLALVPDFEQRRLDPASRPDGAKLYEFVGWLVPVGPELGSR